MRRPRWGLRTLLIFVLIVSLGLWPLVLLRARAFARQDAIEAIDRTGGTYGVRITGPKWYRQLMGSMGVGEKAFYDPLRVSLGPGNQGYDPNRPVRDKELKALRDSFVLFTNLEHLYIQDCPEVTDEGLLSSLPDLPNLKAIELQGTSVTDEGVEMLQRRFPGVEINH